MKTLSPGSRIGQYEIASRPMRGGMGVVYFALDHGNDERPVALKTFRPELLPDRAARGRFLREGTAWIELGSHPNIVRCYKVEYIDPTAFLVLELIAKEQDMPDASLRSWLIPGHPLPLEQALLFALQIARGMQYATEKIPGFVHRDLKPENILVGADKFRGTNINCLRVTDFGLVKTIASGDMPTTASKEEELKPKRLQFTRGVGTPLYMAPEQWKGEPVGVFTDIYAFGCILYEMICGEPAAEGKNDKELQISHCEGKFRSMPPNLPQNVRAFINKCLEISPANRYITWREILGNLKQGFGIESVQLFSELNIKDESSREESMQVGWSFVAIGLAYQDMGNVKLALGYFEKALSIARRSGDRRGEGDALGNLGNAYADLGDAQTAIGYYESEIAITRETSDRRKEGNALGSLGIVYKNLGNVRQAMDYYEQHLMIAREIGDQREEGDALGNLGNAFAELGDIKQAINYHEQSLTIARTRGDRRSEGTALGNLGVAYKSIGDMQSAINYHRQSLLIAHQIGDRSTEANALNNLGIIYVYLGDVQQAINNYEQALTILRETGNRRGQGNVFGALGNAYRSLGNVQQAIEYCNQSLTIALEIGDRSGEGNALGSLGNAYAMLGNSQQALSFYEQYLSIAREIGDKPAEGIAFGNMGVAYFQLGDMQKAITCYEKAISTRREIGDIAGVATDSLNTAVLYAQQREYPRALLLAQEAARIFAQIGSPNEKTARQLIAQLQGISKNRQPNFVQAAFKAFQVTASAQDMQLVVAQYPFMLHEQFIQVIEELITEQVSVEQKAALEQRLDWLCQIADQK